MWVSLSIPLPNFCQFITSNNIPYNYKVQAKSENNWLGEREEEKEEWRNKSKQRNRWDKEKMNFGMRCLFHVNWVQHFKIWTRIQSKIKGARRSVPYRHCHTYTHITASYVIVVQHDDVYDIHTQKRWKTISKAHLRRNRIFLSSKSNWFFIFTYERNRSTLSHLAINVDSVSWQTLF